MRASQRLRVLLWSAVLVTNGVVWGLTVNALYQGRQIQAQRAEALTQNVVSAAEQNLSGAFDRVDLALKSIIDTLQGPTGGMAGGAAGLNQRLEQYATRLPEIQALRLTDATGRVVAGSYLMASDLVSYADRDYFETLRAQVLSELIVTKPIWRADLERHEIVLARRVTRQDGQFAGILQATIDIRYIAQMLTRFDLGPHGTVLVRDIDLGLIARMPHLPEREAGKVGNNLVSDELRKLVGVGENAGTYQSGSSSDGVARILAFERARLAPMWVIAGVSEQDTYANWWATAYKAGGIALGYALMSGLLAAMLLRQLDRTVQESARNRIYLQRASDGVQIIDASGRVLEANDRLCTMLGVTRNELRTDEGPAGTGHWVDNCLQEPALARLLALPDTCSFDTRMRRKDGSVFDVEANVSSFDIGGKRFLYASVRDITERKAASERIEQLAFYDPLTGLPNRRLMRDRLATALANSLRHGWVGALMMLDMDNFKILNDTHGHDLGDQFLIEVGRRLRASLRACDSAARLGGDEFVVILEGLPCLVTAARAAETVADKVRKALSQPYVLTTPSADSAEHSHVHHGTCSIGIALFGNHESSVDEMMKRADTAMYQAKAAGRNAAHFFDPKMQALVTSRSALEADLREALNTPQLQLFYQPQINARGQCIGAEALLRWQHPRRGMVSPGEFIPIAEECGLILPLGQWVLETACQQLAAWQEAGGERAGLSISVNVSARQFHQSDFADQVLGALSQANASSGKLKLELTESLLVRNIDEVIKRMQTLKTHGVSLSLDDFGTGYSSLSYLKRLPLDQLKIDQAFVRDILSDPCDAAIARTVVTMAQSLGLQVIAEGVETEAQWHFLGSLGCQNYQGYLFGKPQALVQFELWLTQRSTAPKSPAEIADSHTTA